MAYPIDGWTGTAAYGGLARSWSTTTAKAYGRAVATRLKGFRNVIWSVGGDYPSGGNPAADARMNAVMAGLRAGGMDRVNTDPVHPQRDQPRLVVLEAEGRLLLRLLLRRQLRHGAAWVQPDPVGTAPPGADGRGALREVLRRDQPLPPLAGGLGAHLRLARRLLRLRGRLGRGPHVGCPERDRRQAGLGDQEGLRQAARLAPAGPGLLLDLHHRRPGHQGTPRTSTSAAAPTSPAPARRTDGWR